MATTVLAYTSDQHAGGATALCPDKVPLDDGGSYLASKTQRWLFQCWGDYWKRAAEVVKAVKPNLYIQAFGGDAVDGAHHRTTQILSENPNAQAAVWNAAVSIPLAQKPDHIAIIRGTEAHVGQSASAEERIADGLARDKRPIVRDPETNSAALWHWRPELNGKLLDITHHGRTGMREHTRGGAAVLYAHDIFLSHAKDGDRPPDLAIRAHHHRFNDSHDACPTRVITSGCWQMPTGYVKKIAADSLPGIGGYIIVLRDGKPIEVEKVSFKVERGGRWAPV
jgi:hypothetical protein